MAAVGGGIQPDPPGVRSIDAHACSSWHDTVAGLLALQAEYVAWYDALPNTLPDTATATALLAIVELDLDELTPPSPPRGFGRD